MALLEDLVVLVQLVPVSVARGLGEEALARDLVRNEAQHETEAEMDRG